MLWIPNLCLLLATSIFWGNQSLQVKGSAICEHVSKKGFIHIHTSDLANIQEICKCEGLRQISFKNCEINALPEGVSEITNLESLDISKTEIERFPDEVLNLTQLKFLNLAFTSIYFLPPDISQLKSLETLNLRGTEISVLPAGLDHLKKIDMRMIEMSRKEQEALRKQYPEVKIYFSSPCNCK